jgi:methylenetetrahydrofolate reductase (NADPH)
VADDPKAVRALGIEEATKLAQRLLDEGAPGLHFITMNFAKATREVMAQVSLPAGV